MWEIMNGMANGVRNRIMPRKKNGMGTMTAVLIGASVGIAAYEALRRSQVVNRLSDDTAMRVAQDVIEQIQG